MIIYHYVGPPEVFATSKLPLTKFDYYQLPIDKLLELLRQKVMPSKIMLVEGENCDGVDLISRLVSIEGPERQISTAAVDITAITVK